MSKEKSSRKVFDKYTKEIYSTEILNIYRPIILQRAENNMSRKHYQELASLLQRLSKNFIGADEFVGKLINEFKHKYAKRPAMMQELSKVKCISVVKIKTEQKSLF